MLAAPARLVKLEFVEVAARGMRSDGVGRGAKGGTNIGPKRPTIGPDWCARRGEALNLVNQSRGT